METITVQLGKRSYPIHIGSGLLNNAELIGSVIADTQVLVVSNEIVAPLYMDRLLRALPNRADTLVLPDGETHKTLATFGLIVDRFIDRSFHRDAKVVALGGGVIGDVVGFAAACYQRGIEFVQVPTTLLAQVDSSVGGKTAVNHPQAKNMIGAFHQPSAVIADTSTLSSLPKREFSAGLAEVIKYGLIVDAVFFEWLEGNISDLMALEEGALTYTVKRCCEIKSQIVAEDEYERGRRALLNFGHTFGHGLEKIGGYGHWLHGEAVAIGMSIAARTAQQLGKISSVDCERIDALLRQAGLPVSCSREEVDIAELQKAMELDKKAGSGGLKLILLDSIGSASIEQAPSDKFLRDILTEHFQA